MNLLELFEEEDEIGIRNPKAAQALKLARTKYSGVADNDLEAFIAMMQDEQSAQDSDIESQFDVNTDQEQSIGGNDGAIDRLEQRIERLERERQTEGINEGPADNFTPDDLQALSKIRDLGTLKIRAMELISNPNSTRPMQPEKVAWFQRAVDSKRNPAAIIKLMYDLLLSGEGLGVKGSQYSTKKNNYRTKFGEEQTGRRQR